MQPEKYQLTLLPVPMPPVLPQALQFPEGSRWVRLTYESTNCYVTDGRSGHSDSYWVYAALIDHFAIALHLAGKNLGSDDYFPTHALLVDVEEQQLWVGEYKQVNRFLNEINQATLPPTLPLTPEQQEAFMANLYAAFDEHQQQMNLMAKTGELQRLIEERMAQEQIFIVQIREFLNQHIKSALKLLEPMRAAAKERGDVQTLMMIDWMKQSKLEN